MSKPRSSPVVSRRRRRVVQQTEQVAPEKSESATLDSVFEKLVSGEVILPLPVTLTESIPRQNDQPSLAAGSLVWIVRHYFAEVAHFADEVGHDVEESAAYNRRPFELLSDRPELDDVQFKTLGEALAHTPRPKQLSCRSSWKEDCAENAASLEMNEVIKVLDSSEHGPDNRLYHYVQRLHDFVDQGDPVRVPPDEEITFSTSLCSTNGRFLPDIVALTKANALTLPLRMRLLDESGCQREAKLPKYTLRHLSKEKCFTARVPDANGTFDTVHLRVSKLSGKVQVHNQDDDLLKSCSVQTAQGEIKDIVSLAEFSPPGPGGFPVNGPHLKRERSSPSHTYSSISPARARKPLPRGSSLKGSTFVPRSPKRPNHLSFVAVEEPALSSPPNFSPLVQGISTCEEHLYMSMTPVGDEGALHWRYECEQLEKKLDAVKKALQQTQRQRSMSCHSSSSQSSSGSDSIMFERSYLQLSDELKKSEAARRAAEAKRDKIIKLLRTVCDSNFE